MGQTRIGLCALAVGLGASVAFAGADPVTGATTPEPSLRPGLTTFNLADLIDDGSSLGQVPSDASPLITVGLDRVPPSSGGEQTPMFTGIRGEPIVPFATLPAPTSAPEASSAPAAPATIPEPGPGALVFCAVVMAFTRRRRTD